jgi:hypothetical protein
MNDHPIQSNPDKCGWRVKPWADAVGCSASHTHKLIAEKKIRSVKMGAARIITTSPKEFLASLEETTP